MILHQKFPSKIIKNHHYSSKIIKLIKVKCLDFFIFVPLHKNCVSQIIIVRTFEKSNKVNFYLNTSLL